MSNEAGALNKASKSPDIWLAIARLNFLKTSPPLLGYCKVALEWILRGSMSTMQVIPLVF